MAVCFEVLAIFCFILFVNSQIDISRWRYFKKVATLSSKEEIFPSHSRVSCAIFCEHRDCDSFVYGHDRKCQMLHGGVHGLELPRGNFYEQWVRSDSHTEDSNAGTLLVYSEENLYWYDISTRERIARVKQHDWISGCEYDTKRRIFYWVQQRGPMKCVKLSLGRAGRERRILRGPAGHFCMDFDKEMIFYSNVPEHRYGDFVRYSRKTKKRKVLVKNINGHFRMWCCAVDTSKQYIFYGETSRGITRIDYNGGDEQIIHRIHVVAISFYQYGQQLFWIEEYPTDIEDVEISKIAYRSAYGTSVTKRLNFTMRDCYSIHVLKDVIYYKTEPFRGVSTVTVGGAALSSIGVMEIGSEDEAHMFLFK